MDVWGPYIWIGLAVIALIVLASVLRQRRAPLHDDRPTEPQKPQATRSGDDPLSREQVAILAVVVAVIIIVVVIAATF